MGREKLGGGLNARVGRSHRVQFFRTKNLEYLRHGKRGDRFRGSVCHWGDRSCLVLPGSN